MSSAAHVPPQGFAADSDPPYGHECGPDCTCFDPVPAARVVIPWKQLLDRLRRDARLN